MACRIEGTLEHAKFYARHLNMCDPQYAALAVLMELEVATDCDGFDYLKRSIIVFMNRPAIGLKKGIYLEVGRQYSPEIDGDNVEASIRRAIQMAWRIRDEEIWAFYFPTDRNGRVKKPSNGEFISRVARFLELWQGCCEEVRYATE